MAILYERSFFRTAQYYKCVIALRYPSPSGQGLLSEGYAAKSFHIKAKSSDAGPTAGFVAVNPLFVKGGDSNVAAQSSRVAKDLSHGARTTSLTLSPQRVSWLLSNGFAAQGGHGRLWAVYHGVRQEFTLVEGHGEAAGRWLVHDAAGEPVNVMANPPHIRGPRDFRQAVTADYDLFGVFARKQQAVDWLPIAPVARIVRSSSQTHRHMAEAYLDSIRLASGAPEDPDAGNVSPFQQVIIKRLNRQIGAEGYSGGDLVQHGDENGNPYSPGQDFPLLFFFPEGDRVMVEDNIALSQTFALIEARGYASNINPAFSAGPGTTLASSPINRLGNNQNR